MNRWLIGFTKLIATFFIIFTYSPSFSQSGDELMANVNVNAFEAAIVEACEMFNGVQQDKARKECGNKVMREFLRISQNLTLVENMNTLGKVRHSSNVFTT